mmetsp:Transcript_19594/g.51972  ORF Transcript_19594/g.51972 Transcript_19594/m.51972 type:complete len:347 (+) Transcript_19594:86-1126(+)
MTQQRLPANSDDRPHRELRQGLQAMTPPLHVLPQGPQSLPALSQSCLPPQAVQAPSYSRADSAYSRTESARSRPESEGGGLREFYFDLPSRGAPPSDTSPRPSTAASTRGMSRNGVSFSTAPENPARPVPLPPIPKSLLCPISQQVMRDPVTAADGITYERECIGSWFKGGHKMSPVTEAELDSLELVENTVLRDAISEYVMLRDFVQSQQREWEGFAALREFRVSQKLAQKRQQVRGLKAALELSERKGKILRNTKDSASGASTTISTGMTTPRSRGSGLSSTGSPRNAAVEQLVRPAAAMHPEEGGSQDAAFKAGKAPRHPAPALQAPRRRRQACPLPVLLGSF